MGGEVGQGFNQLIPLGSNSIIAIVGTRIRVEGERRHKPVMIISKNLKSALDAGSRADLNDFLSKARTAVTKLFQHRS